MLLNSLGELLFQPSVFLQVFQRDLGAGDSESIWCNLVLLIYEHCTVVFNEYTILRQFHNLFFAVLFQRRVFFVILTHHVFDLLAPGGELIISGQLLTEKDYILKWFEEAGFKVKAERVSTEWWSVLCYN